MFTNRRPAIAIQSKTISVMFSIVAETLARIQEHALNAGFLICAFPRKEMGWDPASERRFLEQVRRERHMGLLAFCTPTEPRNDDLLKTMSDEGIRILHVEHHSEEPPAQNFLLPDYRCAGRLVVERMLKAGYQRVIFSRGEHEWPGALLLQKGFVEAVTQCHGEYVPARDLYLYPGGVGHFSDKARVAREFVGSLSPATAVLCTNMSMANEIIGFTREVGLRCPTDVGVIGVPYMDYDVPLAGIDTVEFDWTGYLLSALDRVMQPDWPTIREWVEPRIVCRGSLNSVMASKQQRPSSKRSAT
jgi:DNA-binding LacI/PurR family transcriptional regulator